MQTKWRWIALGVIVLVGGAAGLALWKTPEQETGACPMADEGERLLCEQNSLIRINGPIDSVYAALFSSLQGEERTEAYKQHMVWSNDRKVLLNSSVVQVGREQLMRQITHALYKPETVAQCRDEAALSTNDCAGWRMIRLYREQLAKLLELYPEKTQQVLTQIPDEQAKVFLLQSM